jgi:hypothetical protein
MNPINKIQEYFQRLQIGTPAWYSAQENLTCDRSAIQDTRKLKRDNRQIKQKNQEHSQHLRCA